MDRPSIDTVVRAIVEVRAKRVILSADLARMYAVETRTLNQAVKRNRRRFPRDFVFRLTNDEASAVQRSRSQNVILKRGANLKHRPLAFTEHGAIMAANVLNSGRAIQMSVFVVRAFLRLREWASEQSELAARLLELETRVGDHDHEIRLIIRALRKLIEPRARLERRIGFAPAVVGDAGRPIATTPTSDSSTRPRRRSRRAH